MSRFELRLPEGCAQPVAVAARRTGTVAAATDTVVAQRQDSVHIAGISSPNR